MLITRFLVYLFYLAVYGERGKQQSGIIRVLGLYWIWETLIDAPLGRAHTLAQQTRKLRLKFLLEVQIIRLYLCGWCQQKIHLNSNKLAI